MSEPSGSKFAPVDPIKVGLKGCCPRCGNGRLFDGFLTVKPACSACGLDYGFADAGDGPAVFVMLIVGFLVFWLSGWRSGSISILRRPSGCMSSCGCHSR